MFIWGYYKMRCRICKSGLFRRPILVYYQHLNMKSVIYPESIEEYFNTFLDPESLHVFLVITFTNWKFTYGTAILF